jgi:hypothetical protein
MKANFNLVILNLLKRHGTEAIYFVLGWESFLDTYVPITNFINKLLNIVWLNLHTKIDVAFFFFFDIYEYMFRVVPALNILNYNCLNLNAYLLKT